jgi:hypothetical protein
VDEVVTMWPDTLDVTDGATGKADVVRMAYAYLDDPKPVFKNKIFIAYAYPAIIDTTGDGVPELLWTHCTYMNGLLKANGDCIWQDDAYQAPDMGDGNRSMMGVGDINGDGKLELVGVYKSGVQVRSGQTGALLGRYDGIRHTSREVISGDVDGDGRDEFLISDFLAISCLEQEGGQLRVAWRINTEMPPGEPALADVNGDGLLDLAVCTVGGYLTVYYSPASAAVKP